MKKLKENAGIYLYALLFFLIGTACIFGIYVKFMAYWRVAFD